MPGKMWRGFFLLGIIPTSGIDSTSQLILTVGGSMGKGDKRSKRGKICIGTFGKTRPKKRAKSEAKKAKTR